MPDIAMKASIPGDYRIQVEILNNNQPVGKAYDIIQNVYIEKNNTQLGQLSMGNFDFKFDGKAVNVDVRVKFQFENSISPDDHEGFKVKFFDAVKNKWTNSGASLVPDSSEGHHASNIPIKISC